MEKPQKLSASQVKARCQGLTLQIPPLAFSFFSIPFAGHALSFAIHHQMSQQWALAIVDFFAKTGTANRVTILKLLERQS
jgi:hypothetical protein